MRKAAFIVGLLELLVSPLILWLCYNYYMDMLKITASEPISPEALEMIRNIYIVACGVAVVLGVTFFVVAQILIANKRKIPAGVLTIIFVSKIAGVLTFFISYDEDKKIEPENYIPVEEEETNETRSRNKCPFCGKVVSKFDEFCPHCKHKLF